MTNQGVAGFPSAPPAAVAAAGRMASGSYYYTSGPRSTSTSLTTGDNLVVMPWVVPHALTLSRIGAEVSGAGNSGTTVRLGIYADNNGFPGALILDAGTINGNSATVQQITINQTLSAGVVWIGGAAQGVSGTAPTVRTHNDPPPVAIPLIGGVPSSNTTAVGLYVSSVTGALPATFGTPAGYAVAAAVVRVFVKVA